jgi:hypothetical protein
MTILKRFLALTMLSGALLAPPAANAASVARYKTNLPPSAELAYTIKARQKGIPIDGEAVMRWTAAAGKFTATNEARAILVGKILYARTEGEIDPYGLAPALFTEKRFRKEATTTSFDRAAGTIRFTGSDHTYPINGGEQDRNSVIWELIAVVRATPGKIRPGAGWSFFVAGQRDAEQWTFKVVRQEKLRTPFGDLNTLHIARVPPPDSKEQYLDIWLAPSIEWYPARLRFSDDNGDYIEQTLQKVNRKDS